MKIFGGPKRRLKMVNRNAKTEAEDSGSSCLTVHDSKPCEGSKEEEKEQQLLPGILNEITINQIAPKLPWTAFYILSLVSRGWQKAIQSHQIYEARVRSQRTQMLVVLHQKYGDGGNNCISVCSSEDGKCWTLPRIPGFRSSVQCISMDCKLYIIGGFKEQSRTTYSEDGPEVHVFDLAGQRQWKQLASMKTPRSDFGCGVMKGKIYVFGGTSDEEPVCISEVFDPEENAWSPVAPMISFRAFHNVAAVGEELVLHNGQAYHPDFVERTRGRPDLNPYSNGLIWDASSAEIYDTVKDEWRSVEHFIEPGLNYMVTMQGKLHNVTERGIDIYDTQANAWEPLHSFSWADSFSVCGYAAVPVDNDELLLVVGWQNITAPHHEPSGGTGLLRSQGCGDKNKEVVWQKIECSFPLGGMSSSCLCPIQI